MKIGIVCAMDSERKQVTALLNCAKEENKRYWIYTVGELYGNEIIVAKSGIGKVNAALQASNMIEQYAPDCLLNTGVAGGIDTCLRVMDVVVASKTAYHDVDCGPEVLSGQIQDMPLYFDADLRLLKAALQVKNKTKIHSGLICTGDQFITNRNQLNKIKDFFPEGLAVDMESAALAQVCYIYQTPFLSFRIISDTPGVEGHIDQYFNFWEEMADRSFAVTQGILEEISKLTI